MPLLTFFWNHYQVLLIGISKTFSQVFFTLFRIAIEWVPLPDINEGKPVVDEPDEDSAAADFDHGKLSVLSRDFWLKYVC